MARIVVNVDVADLERGTRFYTRAFGLRIGRRFGSDAIELVGAEVSLYLLVASGAPHPGATEPRRYERHWTPVHLDFVVDDIEVAVAAALAEGARLEAPSSQHRYGKLAVLADPFGNGFCFLQFEGRGYDEIATAVG
ncbi:MAG TPA: VOC family protein [Anaeromyxobacter sp.]|nr:VOC family protein [Anaeromyxobacter sp.]